MFAILCKIILSFRKRKMKGIIVMAVFYVFQGKTYSIERAGGFVWSPTLNQSGGNNAGYLMMTKILKGDYILHNCNGKIVSISVASSNCYESSRPSEFAAYEWRDDGYMVDTEYFDLPIPVITRNYKTWLADNYVEGSAFTRTGTGKQQYMCNLADNHAIFLIEQAIELQQDIVAINYLNGALSDIVNGKDFEYNKNEIEQINQLIEEPAPNNCNEGIIEREPQPPLARINCLVPRRNLQCAANALKNANFKCEYNIEDRTFLRKNGNPYTEPHHLIPLSKYRDFNYSVDVEENIVSLCSHCHNLLHYGKFNDKVPILEKLYAEREEKLHSRGLEITWERLKSYYV